MIRTIRITILAFSFVFTVTAAGFGWAQTDDKGLGTFQDWNAQIFAENGKPTCSIWSKPIKDTGEYKTRGDIYLYVTHRPIDKRTNVVQIAAGYRYKKGSEVHVRIGGQTFKLFTEYDTAWARTSATDRKLVGAMRRGNSMVVTGISSRGTSTMDTYSLKGIAKAHDRINTACGVKWK